MAQQEVIEILKKYILLLNSEGISVDRAFLFGSYSSDTATESSDIDVMIVSNKFDETDDQAIGKIWSLTRKVNTKIEPFMIGLEKFNSKNPSPLLRMIKSQGIEIIQ